MGQPEAREDRASHRAGAAARRPCGAPRARSPRSTTRARSPASTRDVGKADRSRRRFLRPAAGSAPASPSRCLGRRERPACDGGRDERDAVASAGRRAQRGGVLRRISDRLFRNPRFSCAFCWRRRFSGSASSIWDRCFALLAQSFFSIDEFSGLIKLRIHAFDLWRAFPPRQSRRHLPQPR